MLLTTFLPCHRGAVVATALAISAFALHAPGARSACEAPPSPSLEVLYPTPGARNVPTDTGLFYYASGRVTLTVDGESLPAPELALPFALADLEPQAEHTASFNIVDGSAEDALNETLTFSTGAAAADAPQVPLVTGVTVFNDDNHLSDGCRNAILRFSCFDTGPPVYRQFDVEGEASLWRVTVDGFARLLPGQCAPEVATLSSEQSGCATIAAVSAAGVVAAAEPFCWGESEVDLPVGCSASTLPRSSTAAAILAGLACCILIFRRRIRHS